MHGMLGGLRLYFIRVHPVVRVLLGFGLVVVGIGMLVVGAGHGPGLIIVGSVIVVGTISSVLSAMRDRRIAKRHDRA